ncbi:MAG TPA: hypothetical protein VFX96_13885 [Pyrinomonadaceae bacterium]|nr:hypothetical protein [Pyrinomonadaceae bacterium]
MFARQSIHGAENFFSGPGEDAPPGGAHEGGDDSLEDAAEHELDDMRARLREELGREPSEEELSEWLRQHTEGY